MTPKEERKTWIDQSKGLAIMLVVLGHVVTNGMSSGIVSDIGVWSVLNKEIYSFHMPLFFLLSGYLSCPKNIQIDDWGGIEKQFKKILFLTIPYVIFSVFYFLAKLFTVSSGAVVNPVHANDILLIYKMPIGEYWFLYALILYNVVNLFFLICVKVCKRRALYKLLIIVFTLLSFIVVSECVDISEFMVKHSGLRRPFLHSFYFFIGIIVHMYELRMDRIANNICVAAALVLSVLFLNIISLKSGLFCCLLAITMIFLTVKFFKWKDVSFIGEFGKYSLAIYLMHPFFIVLCKIVLSRSVGVSLYVIIATVLSIALPYSLYVYFIRRVDVLNFVFEPKKYLSNESGTKDKLPAE